MKLNFKNVFLSVGIFAFVFALVGVLSTNKAEAYTRTADTSGSWGDVATWAEGAVPVAGDAVTINAAVTVDIDTTAAATSITFVDPAAGAGNGLTFTGANTLTVSGAITVPLSSGVGTTTIAVGTGSLTAGSVSITGGASGIGSMTVSTGAITTTGDFTLAGVTSIAKALLTSTNAGSEISIGGNFVNTLGTVTNLGLMTITGNLTGAGTVINDTNGSLHLNGTTNTVTTLTATAAGNTVTYGGTAQTVIDTATHAYYNLILEGSGVKTLTGITTIQGMQINGTASATTAADIAIAANLIVSAGATLHLADHAFSVGTTTDISGTLDTTVAATGTKTFSGLVTVASGGSFSLTAFDPVTVFGAGITNNSATTMNMGSGASTLTGNIGGTGAITWEGAGGLTIAGAQTTTNNNTGTVTVTGTLTLTGAWTQAAGSSLVLLATTATSGAGVLTTTAANTVTYGGGTQTLNATAAGYYNLTLSGTGAKTWIANNDVTQTLTVNTGSTITLVDNLISANKLYFGTAFQKKGTWGAVASAAAHKTNTQFTTGVNQFMTVTLGKSTTVQQDGTTVTTCGTGYTLTNGVCTASTDNTTTTTTTTETTTTTTPVVEEGCSGGNAYNSNTGAVCVNNATSEIPGCGNRNTGFSSASGVSCAQNKVTTQTQEQTQTQTQTQTTYNFGTKTLKNGSTGSAVVELQKFLNAKLNLGLVLDGKLGPKTIAVIKQWQKANGLVADGLVGPATKAKMNAQ